MEFSSLQSERLPASREVPKMPRFATYGQALLQWGAP
jgi:hypothetical protein